MTTLREKIDNYVRTTSKAAVVAIALGSASPVYADTPASTEHQYSHRQCEADGISREFCDYMIKQQNELRQEDLSAVIGAINGKECLSSQELVLHLDYPQAAGVSTLFGASPEREFMRMLRSKGYQQVQVGEQILGIRNGEYFFRGAESASSVRPDALHLYVHYTERGPEGITYEIMVAKGKTVYVDRAIAYQQARGNSALSIVNGQIRVDSGNDAKKLTRRKIEEAIPPSCGIPSSGRSGCPPCPPCEKQKNNGEK